MNITLEAVEKVMEQTGVDYKAAKEALVKTDGDVDAAIRLIRPDTKEAEGAQNTETESSEGDIKDVVDKLKKKVEEGNVDRIQIRKGDEIVFNVPVNVGIVGGIIGLAAAPWVVIAGAAAAFGLGCRFLVVKKDGTIDEIK